MLRKLPTLGALAAAIFYGTNFSFADTIKLESGGTIRGEILDDKSNAKSVVVKLPSGGEVTFGRDKIQEIIREKTATQQYEETRASFADTAEDQFKLAMWCEQNQLLKQKRIHLERVVELDPDHAKAREKLGFVRKGDKWLTPDQVNEAKGLVKFNGRYVTQQEKEILEQKKREDELVREWYQKIRMWKTWYAGNDASKARQGEDNLRRIEDPKAIEAVVGQFGKERVENLRVLMCDILGGIQGETATLELVKRCIVDASANVRWAAIDRLVEREDPSATKSLIRVLQSDHPAVIRRAADALGAIGDPTAIAPLINVLITKEKQIVTRGATGVGIGSSRPAVVEYEPVVAPGVVAFKPIVGMQTQGVGISTPRQEVVEVEIELMEVRDALTKITKQDFGYDQVAWRQWYANQLRREDIKKRRERDENDGKP